MSASLRLCRVSLREANAFVEAFHRHHKASAGHIFSIGAAFADNIVGVAIVGRPVARERDDGATAEVLRLCSDGVQRQVRDKAGNVHSLSVCSFLYSACARAAFALGFQRIGTYILESETGATLRASNWREIGKVRGRSWSAPELNRPRIDKHPLVNKALYELSLRKRQPLPTIDIGALGL